MRGEDFWNFKPIGAAFRDLKQSPSKDVKA